mgnify:CR=1 FL=1
MMNPDVKEYITFTRYARKRLRETRRTASIRL